jgi:hypothetical protein
MPYEVSTMTIDDNDPVVRLWRQLWIDGDDTAIAELLTDPFVRHTTEGRKVDTPSAYGHQGIKVSVLCPQAVQTNIVANSPDAETMQSRGADVAGADGHLTAEEAVDVVVQALRVERFHVLPHPEVEEYVRRKGDDVDRWITGMQRWQQKMFADDMHPATWLTGS